MYAPAAGAAVANNGCFLKLTGRRDRSHRVASREAKAAAPGSDAERHLAFADTLRMLRNRIEIFTNLPFQSLDKLALQTRLDDIGRAS